MYSVTEFFRHSRIVHVYVSAFLFTLLALFSLTGLLLNHPEWFEQTPQSANFDKQLSSDGMALLSDSEQAEWQPDLIAVLAYFQKEYGLGSPDAMNWDRDYGEISFDFSAPGSYAQIYLDTANGQYEMLAERTGWIEILNDLHKGQYSGAAWSWVIDLSAVFIVVFSITGLIILANSIRFRTTAFALVFLGSLTPLLIYLFWVPSISVPH